MNEIPTTPEIPETPENPDEAELERIGEEMAQEHLRLHPVPEISPENKRECGPEFTEFMDMVSRFEATYSLVDLVALTDLTFEESREHPLRQPARQALIPIVAKLNVLRDETNIDPEMLRRVNERYTVLARAVGYMKRDRIYHD